MSPIQFIFLNAHLIIIVLVREVLTDYYYHYILYFTHLEKLFSSEVRPDIVSRNCFQSLSV